MQSARSPKWQVSHCCGLARARAEDVEAVSKLVKEYSGSMGLRVVGIIVCKEVTDGLLSLLKELRDVEVVFTTRRILGV